MLMTGHRLVSAADYSICQTGSIVIAAIVSDPLCEGATADHEG